MRFVICCLLFLSRCAPALAEYEPLRVTVIEYAPLRSGNVKPRPNRAPPVVATVHCVTIRGVDYDLEPILAEYRVAWTWPGGTEETLREHLREDHGVTGIESLTDRQIRQLHAVLHERERKIARAASGPPPVSLGPVRSSSCPGGVCPAPARSRVPMFGRRVMWFR